MLFNVKFALQSGLLMIGALTLACGGDDGSSTPATPGGGDAGTGAGGSTVTYSATLVTVLGTSKADAIPTPHKIEALNNDTGAAFSPAVSTTSAQTTGDITLQVPKGKFIIKVTGVGAATAPASTYDSVIVNNDSTILDPLVRLSNTGTLSLAEGSGKYTANPERAALGATIYHSPGGKRAGFVGCATVFIDGKTAPDLDQDQRYNAASGLPGRISCEATDTGCTPVTKTLAGGRFFFGNVTKGKHTVKVSIDNGATFLTEVSFFVPYSRAEASSETKSVLVQLGVDIDVPTNPTPAGCTP